MSAKDRITAAACSIVQGAGLATVTVGQVAVRAGVSSALVHYHFATKDRLLAAAAARLAERRADARSAAWGAGKGLAMLDGLWGAIVSDAGVRLERAWRDIALLARSDGTVHDALAAARLAEHAAVVNALPSLVRELGATPPIPAEELASVVIAFIDGLAAQLDEGTPSDVLRTSFDAFWLVLASEGEAPQRR